MKPILMNTNQVKTVLENKKIIIRLPVKMPFEELMLCRFVDGDIQEHMGYPLGHDSIKNTRSKYHKGDILYVRETWQKVWNPEWCFDEKPAIEDLITNFNSIYKVEADTQGHEGKAYIVFKADDLKYSDEEYTLNWCSSTHMPKEAARIFLEVADIKIAENKGTKEYEFEYELIKIEKENI